MNTARATLPAAPLPTSQRLSLAEWLLLAACIGLPFSTGIDSPIGVQSLGLPLLTLCVLVTGFNSVGRSTRLSTRLIVGLLLAWASVLWMTFTTAFAPAPLPSLTRALLNLMGALFLSVAILGTANGAAALRLASRVSLGIILATSICSAYYTINILLAIAEHGADLVLIQRFVGGLMSLPWGASNSIAALLILGLGVLLIEAGRFRRSTWILLGALHLVAILLTLSRNGIVVALILLAWGGGRSVRRAMVGLLILAALLVTAVIGSIDLSAFDALIADRLTGGSEVSNGRIDTWTEKLDYFLANPLSPVGYYGNIYRFELSAHNFLLNTLVEQGVFGAVVGAFLFGWLLLTGGWRTAPSANGPSMSYRKLWALMALNMAFEDPNFTQPFIVIFWLVVASQTLRLRGADLSRAMGEVSSRR